MSPHPPHHGHNIKRLREIQGVKQQTLARELGQGWNQKKVSLLESRPSIRRELLAQVAAALGVSSEVLAHFREEMICHQLSTVQPQARESKDALAIPVNKVLALLEENKRPVPLPAGGGKRKEPVAGKNAFAEKPNAGRVKTR